MTIEELWSDDVLNRKADVIYLQKYIASRYHKKKTEPGFVMAVNADWGFGKSFMLSRWKTQAAIEGHPAVFFDAWQSDFTADPLLAFMAELDTALQKYFAELPIGEKLTKAAIGIIKKSWKPVLMVLGSAALKHAAGVTMSQLSTMAGADSEEDESKSKKLNTEELQKNLKAAVEKALKAHTTIKDSIVEFRKKLSGLITALENAGSIQLPMIIFIDELDRCRPDYAIELLEGIKHLFGVPGVYFIIATNVKQLGESVKAIYGSGFDGEKYLKRFFDLQYSLREPDNGQFAKAIFLNSPLPVVDNIIYGFERLQTLERQEIVAHIPFEIFGYILRVHADAFGLGLRDMLQISTVIESCLISLNYRRVHAFLLIFLAVVFHKDHELFLRISRSHALPPNDQMVACGYRAEVGKINFRYYDDEGRSQKKEVDLLDVARLYISLFNPGAFQNHIRAGGYIFPNNLVDSSAMKNVDNKLTIEFSDYFSLVKHAGGFSV